MADKKKEGSGYWEDDLTVAELEARIAALPTHCACGAELPDKGHVVDTARRFHLQAALERKKNR